VTDERPPGALADDAIGGQAVGALEALDGGEVTGVDPEQSKASGPWPPHWWRLPSWSRA
jgi:hypothetical protein